MGQLAAPAIWAGRPNGQVGQMGQLAKWAGWPNGLVGRTGWSAEQASRPNGPVSQMGRLAEWAGYFIFLGVPQLVFGHEDLHKLIGRDEIKLRTCGS